MSNPPSRRGEDDRGAGYIGRFDPNYKHGQEVHGDLRVEMPRYADAFGRLIADGTRNTLDLPAHYTLNPERYRIREQGSRVEIANTTQVTDEVASFKLTSAADERTTLHTAERPRYAVGYESVASWEFQLLDALEDGDFLRVGLRDFESPENAAYWEFTGPSSDDRVVLEGGSFGETASKTIPGPANRDWSILNPLRPFIQFNWYRVGRFLFGMTYTDADLPLDEAQQNEWVTELSSPDEPSTEQANLYLFWELEVGTGNTTKELSAGSLGYRVLGDVTTTVRAKAARFTGLTITNSGLYEPIVALRVDPVRENVFTDITNIDTVFDAGDGEVLAISVPPTFTDADFDDPENDGTNPGPRAPRQHNDRNSVLQYTKDITTFPDTDDNIVTEASDPGGYQIGFAATDATQSGAGRSQESLDRKRQLHGDNVAVILAKRDSAQSATVNVAIETEQDW